MKYRVRVSMTASMNALFRFVYASECFYLLGVSFEITKAEPVL